MSITITARRILATLVEMLHTRLNLISVEIEEELLRFFSYLMAAFILLFCGLFAVASLLVLILVLFWEEHRIAVLVSFITIFSAISGGIVIWLRIQITNKPPLLQQSIAEFKKDTEMLRTRSDETEPNLQAGQGLS